MAIRSLNTYSKLTAKGNVRGTQNDTNALDSDSVLHATVCKAEQQRLGTRLCIDVFLQC